MQPWHILTPEEEAALPQPTIEQRKAALWERTKAERDRRDVLPGAVCQTSFGLVQCDDASKIKISGFVQMALIAKSLGAPFSREFTMADNSVVDFDADQAIQFGVEVGGTIDARHAYGRLLRAQIEGALDEQDLSEIDPTYGWP